MWPSFALAAWSSSAGQRFGGGGEPQVGEMAAQLLVGRVLAHRSRSLRRARRSGPGRRPRRGPRGRAAWLLRRGRRGRVAGWLCGHTAGRCVNAESTTRLQRGAVLRRCARWRPPRPAPGDARPARHRPVSGSRRSPSRAGAAASARRRRGRAAPSSGSLGTRPSRCRATTRVTSIVAGNARGRQAPAAARRRPARRRSSPRPVGGAARSRASPGPAQEPVQRHLRLLRCGRGHRPPPPSDT